MATATAPQGVPSGFVAIRPFLRSQGVADEDIGFDQPTGTVLVRGQRFFRPSINISGRTFANPSDLPDVAPFLAAGQNQVQAQPRQQSVLEELRQEIQRPLDFEDTPFFDQFEDLAERRGQAASERALAEANRRGILPSSITAGNVAQAQADTEAQLLPTFLQRAQAARQQRIGNLSSLFSVENQLEQQRQEQARLAEDRRIEAAQREIDRAWNRAKNIGFIDNAASVVLGLPVGTPTFEAQQAVEDRKARLQLARVNNAAQLQRTREQQASIAAREASARQFRTPLEQIQDDAARRVANEQGTAIDYALLGLEPPVTAQQEPDAGPVLTPNAQSSLYQNLLKARSDPLTWRQLDQETKDEINREIEQLRTTLFPGEGSDTTNAADPTIADQVREARDSGLSDGQIAQMLQADGIDPSLYGVGNQAETSSAGNNAPGESLIDRLSRLSRSAGDIITNRLSEGGLTGEPGISVVP